MTSLILLSVITTTLLSGLIATGVFFIKPDMALGSFFLSTAFIIIVMEPINRLLRARTLEKEAEAYQKATEMGEVAGKQLISLECEYCQEANPVQIQLNEENAFNCKSCNNENKVLISFTTSRTSAPFKLEVPEHVIKDELSALEEVPDDEQPTT